LVLVAVLSAAGCTAGPAAVPGASPSVEPTTEADVGGQLVFVRYNVALEDDEVFVIGADGTGERQLLEGPRQCPRWSPDGTQVAISGISAPAFVLADGNGLRELASPDGRLILGCGVWSPDGARYFSESWDDSDPSRTGIYSYKVADGGDLRRITTPPAGGWDGVADVSPDGQLLCFSRDGDLYLIRTNGADEELLAEGFESGAWSPDGSMILVDAEGSLYLIGVDDGEVRELTSSSPAFTAEKYGARWSPDGSRIAFSMVSPGPYADLYTMRPDGSELRRVTHSPQVSNELGSWTD
jgi:Tol biopolymer transport system component